MGLERFLGAGGSAHRHQRHGTHSLRARCVPAPSARQPRTHSIARLTLPANSSSESTIIPTRNSERGVRNEGVAFNSVLRGREFFLEIDDLFYLNQKPPVDPGQVEYLFDGESGAEGVADEED